MDFEPLLDWVFAVVLVCGGVYGLWTGEVHYGSDYAEPEDCNVLYGWRARLSTAALAIAGIMFPLDRLSGIVILCLVILLPWLLERI